MKPDFYPNLLIIGHGRHGKDTVAEIFNEYFGLTFKSSSEAAAEIFLYDLLKDKYGYKSFSECYADRHNHRAEWYEGICEYNKEDPARLAKDIMATNNIYVGMRDWRECKECLAQRVFDLIIWVDRSDHEPEEPKSSFNIDKSIAHIIIDNNGNLDQLRERTVALGNTW